MDDSINNDMQAEVSDAEPVRLRSTDKNSLFCILLITAKREEIFREHSIMTKKDQVITPSKVEEFIEQHYCKALKTRSPLYWENDKFMYANFITKCEKKRFLDWVVSNSDKSEIKKRIQDANEGSDILQGENVPFMINKVSKTIKTEFIEIALKQALGNDNYLINFREDNADTKTGVRNIKFSTNTEGVRKLILPLRGILRYENIRTGKRTSLPVNINCKPLLCRDCFNYGTHQCEGKLCANCGLNKHLSKDCKLKSKFCKNCRIRGHRAMDTRCPLYLIEVAKEVRKYCIPLEYFTDLELRYLVSQQIQIA